MERIPVEVIRVWVLVQSCILWLGTMEGPRRDPEPSARGGFWENPRCESPQSSGGLRSGICWEYHWFLLPFPLANYSNVHCCFHDPTHQPFAHCSIDGPVSYLKKKTKKQQPRSELSHIMSPICTCCPVCTSLKLPVSREESDVSICSLATQPDFPGLFCQSSFPLIVFSLLAPPNTRTCSHPGNSALPAPHGSMSATLTLFPLPWENLDRRIHLSVFYFFPSFLNQCNQSCCGFIPTPSGNYKYSSLLLNVLLF